MKRTGIGRAILAAAAILLLGGVAHAADYAGTYSGSGLSVVLAPGAGGYVGQMVLNGQTFPLTAHEDGSKLAGTFTSAGNSYDFVATPQGSDLTLDSGGNSYALHRLGAPQPAAQAPPSGVIPGNPPGDALANYVVMNKTAVGQSLVRELPTVKTTIGAMRSVFPDLTRYFGVRPTVSGAYEDQQDHQSSYVSFTTTLNGQPIKGFVTAKLRDQGAVAFVVFGNAGATRDEWTALTGAPPANSTQKLMDAVPLQPYSFPDGTGAIGLADGWHTQSKTESGLLLTGPADQTVQMAYGVTGFLPSGRPSPFLVAPYNPDPAIAMAYLVRANGQMSQRRGGPGWAPIKLIKEVKIPAKSPGRQDAQVTYDLAVSDHGVNKVYRVLTQFEVTPPSQGAWNIYFQYAVKAPPATFDHDVPVMLAQVFSMSENAAAIQAKGAAERANAAALAKAQQDAAEKIAQAHYAGTRSVEEDEQIKMRSITDFDETIRGERTVEDTQTGETASADLGNVHDIVDHLNEFEPGRYKEIPLRDQVFPMPGHENDPDYLAR